MQSKNFHMLQREAYLEEIIDTYFSQIKVLHIDISFNPLTINVSLT